MAIISDRERVQQLQQLLNKWNPNEKCQYYPGERCSTYNTQGRLIKLHLCGLSLKQVPSEVWQFSDLQELFLSNNQLTTLPPELGNLSSLQKLFLDYNQLTILPPELGNLSSLQDLRLNNNLLTTLSPELRNLSSLRILSLNNNLLTTLPPELGNLSSLLYLYLNNNQLTTLPPELGNLSSLLYLHLNNNQLTTLPPELGNLSSLQELSLDNNQLTTLPPELSNLSSLQELFLNNNPLQTPPPHIIEEGTTAILAYLQPQPDALDTYLASQSSPLSPPQSTHTITLFYLYSHEDKKLLNELEKHVSGLRLQRLVIDQHDGHIPGGADWKQAVKTHLDAAQVILLLVSPDFMASDNTELLQQAMQRHATGETRVVPILLRPVDRAGAPFASLPHLPTTGKPITLWPNHDEAFFNIVQELRILIQEIFSARFQNIQKDLQTLNANIDELRNPYTQVERSLEHMSKEQENLAKQCSTIENQITALHYRLQGLQQQIATLPEKQQHLEQERQNLQHQALELHNQQSTLEQESQILTRQIEQAKTPITH